MTYPTLNLLGKLEKETSLAQNNPNPVYRDRYNRRARNTFTIIRSIARDIVIPAST